MKDTNIHIKKIKNKLQILALIIVFNKGFDFVLFDILSHLGNISLRNWSADNSLEKIPNFKFFDFWAERNNLIVQAKKIWLIILVG